MASQPIAESAVAARPTPPHEPSLTLKRRINASPEKIYAAWTQPENLIRWFGPAMVKQETVRAAIEARIGGRYRISFDDDRGEHHEVGGIYRELVPHSRLVFSWVWHSTPERESRVTVLLKSDGAATLLTLHHEQLFDVAARDAHQHGWSGTLDKLQRSFA
jgi:uncharacterized protein YndB with AHSA1/START domain